MKGANKRQTFNEPGHAHELTFSVLRRQKKMFEPGVAEAFVENLRVGSEKLEFDIWAYVVMPDHCHVLLYPREEVYEMKLIKQAIKQPVSEAVFKLYPQWKETMNAKRKRGITPRFWQQVGGYDRNLFTPVAIQAAIDYIHNNPVRKGFVDSPTEWPWSSARNYEGLAGEIPVVLYSWLS